jgi:hypothetical protein
MRCELGMNETGRETLRGRAERNGHDLEGLKPTQPALADPPLALITPEGRGFESG